MRCGEVGDVDIVADRSAVGRVVVVAEDRKVRHVSLQRHHRARNEVRLEVAQLADAAGRIGAAGVEVAQRESIRGRRPSR